MADIVAEHSAHPEVGAAVVDLLRTLSVFAGVGNEDLREFAALFVQKLFRPGDQVFAKGDSGDESYVVLRGKVNIQLEANSPPVDQLGDGKIFGEMAFLDGLPRNAFAIAVQPSILLVIKQTAFAGIVERNPRLGMIVMRNIARDLALKLRGTGKKLTGKA